MQTWSIPELKSVSLSMPTLTIAFFISYSVTLVGSLSNSASVRVWYNQFSIALLSILLVITILLVLRLSTFSKFILLLKLHLMNWFLPSHYTYWSFMVRLLWKSIGIVEKGWWIFIRLGSHIQYLLIFQNMTNSFHILLIAI